MSTNPRPAYVMEVDPCRGVINLTESWPQQNAAWVSCNMQIEVHVSPKEGKWMLQNEVLLVDCT